MTVEMTAEMTLDQVSTTVQQIKQHIQQVIIGQDQVIDLLLVAFIADGHVLLEGVPGLGKTLLVKTIASSFSGSFARIQFTPDLMPADVTGHVLFNPKTGEFEVRQGPIFTQLLLADEINRAPAKTQSALLEVMQEGQITLEGRTHTLERPFMVFATQNPIDHEGTYPLPEAQLDRFLMKIDLDYPSATDEASMLRQLIQPPRLSSVTTAQAVVSAADCLQLQAAVHQFTVDERIMEYALRIVRTTRDWGSFAHGSGPRGGIALLKAAQAYALLNGRSYVIPDDVKFLSLPILRHRVWRSAEMEIEGRQVDDLLRQMLDQIEAPRQ
ncbi:MAG: AAA family ATPase [Flavobacteriales bacterium]